MGVFVLEIISIHSLFTIYVFLFNCLFISYLFIQMYFNKY